MEQDQSIAFLPLFITEPVYLPVEPTLDHLDVGMPNDQTMPLAATQEEIIPEVVAVGKNRRSILILINEEGDQYVSEAHERLLHNILKAVALTMDDIRLINIRKNNMDHPSFIKALESPSFTTLISFGAVVPEWPVCHFFSKYAISTDSMNRKVLLADSLSLLSADPAKKKSLWMCLQDLFM